MYLGRYLVGRVHLCAPTHNRSSPTLATIARGLPRFRAPRTATHKYPPSKTRLSVCCKQLSHTLAHCGRRVCALASPSPFLAPSLTFFLPRCPLSARSTRGQPLPASPSTTMADSLHSSSLSPPCRLLRTAGLCRPVAAGYTMFLCRSSVRLPDLLMRPRARTAPRHASCPRSFSSSSLLTSACSFCSKRYVRSLPPPPRLYTHKGGGRRGRRFRPNLPTRMKPRPRVDGLRAQRAPSLTVVSRLPWPLSFPFPLLSGSLSNDAAISGSSVCGTAGRHD